MIMKALTSHTDYIDLLMLLAVVVIFALLVVTQFSIVESNQNLLDAKLDSLCSLHPECIEWRDGD
jgi:hypothetical protein